MESCSPISMETSSPSSKRQKTTGDDASVLKLCSLSAMDPVEADPHPATEAENGIRIEHVGDREMGMVLVYPPKGPEHDAVTLLRLIDVEMKRPQTKRRFLNFVRQQSTDMAADESVMESCRMIQGGRLEIFLQAKDKSSVAFDTIVGAKFGNGAKEVILDYCRDQANRDPRLQIGRYRYENFSILASLNKRPAQAPHLDLVHPNYQFGVVLTDQTEGTMFVENQDQLGRVATVEDLEKLWTENPAFADDQYKEMPANIKEVFNDDSGAKQLLQYFGDTLLPEGSLVKHMISRDKLPAGTLASLPGSVVHAGPASKGMRSILFFSGTPEDSSTVDPYLPDSQYNGVTLMGHLVSILWRRDKIETVERHYLLRRLVQYVEGTSAKEAWAQFGDGELKEYVKAIQKKSYKGKKEDFVYKKAHCLEMFYGNDPFSTTNNIIDVDSLVQISCDNLFTSWEGTELPVKIYKRVSDQKIVIRYLTKGPDDVCPDEYEGHRPEERLKLTMHDGISGKFDGSNGTLLDGDGEVIEIFKGSRVASH